MAQEKLTPLFLFDDEPVRAHTDDHLALKPFSSMIAAAALGNRGPFNIGVFSGWGQGKTSVLRQARSLIEAQRKPHIVTAWVNAWQYEHEEHPIVPLLAVIINEITKALDERETQMEKAKKGTSKLFKDLSRALRSIAYGFSAKTDVKIPGFAGLEVGFVAKDMIDRDEKLSADRDPLLDQSLYYHAYDRLEKFRAALGDPKHLDQPRIVVFIDDLDRCQPNNALHLLESLKLVLAQPGFIFVLAVDRRVIDAFLTKRYHEKFGITPDKLHGKQYMDKIIQLPLDLPHHQNRFEKYIGQLIRDPNYDKLIPQEFRNLFSDEKTDPAFISALAAGCDRCPRTLIRTLNYLLTDFFLRQNNFFIAENDPFVDGAEEFLRFAAVSRITRITFGSEHERLYRRMVHHDHACEELAEFLAGNYTLKAVEATRNAAINTIRGRSSAAAARSQSIQAAVADYEPPVEKDSFDPYLAIVESSDSLQELFRTPLGRTWLKEHAKRQTIEGYLATRQEQEPDQNSVQIINKAIREALDLKDDIPLTDDLRLKVTRLDLSDTLVCDVTPLRSLADLQELFLLGAPVSEVTSLQSLTKLQTLSLGRTLVIDLTPLRRLVDLQRLHLDRTPVGDVTPLQSLVNLRVLDLTYAEAVSDVKQLRGLANLQVLELSGTSVSDVTPLRKLADLRLLDLSRTPVSDVTPLHSLGKLRELHLDGTPAAGNEAAMAALREALPDCAIYPAVTS